MLITRKNVMIIIDKHLNIDEDLRCYIKECYDNNRDKHVYVDEDLFYYNKLKVLKCF